MTSTRFMALTAFIGWTVITGGHAHGANIDCKAEAPYTQQAKNADPWDSLRIWMRGPPTSVEVAQAEMDRVGGSRVLLEIDSADVRRQLLGELRDDTRQVFREAKIAWSRPPMVRDGAVEVKVRNAGETERILGLIAATVAVPLDGPSARSVEVTDMGDGLIRLTPAESAVVERIGASQRFAVHVLEKRINQLGLTVASVQPAGFGRILAVLPGLSDPDRLTRIMDSMARLDFRLLDTSTNACEAMDGQMPADSEILFRYGSKAPFLVKKQILFEGHDLTDVAVALDRRTEQPTVVFRLTTTAAYRLAKASEDYVGQTFAMVLDNAIMATAVIREPLIGAVQISGGLSLREADEFAILLRAGIGVPRFIVVEQQIVHPLPEK